MAELDPAATAKLVGGVWMPATERHFVEMMRPGA